MADAEIGPRPAADRSTIGQLLLAQAEHNIEAGRLGEARLPLEELTGHNRPGWPRTLASAALALIDACAGTLSASEQHIALTLDDLEGLVNLEHLEGHLEHLEGHDVDHVENLDDPYELDSDRRGRTTVATYTHLAATLTAAQRGAAHRPAFGHTAERDRLHGAPQSLRCTFRAIRAATSGSAPTFVCLDEPTARHPLAGRALLSLGVLEVVDPAGRSTLLGGDGERIVLDARRHLAEGRPESSEAQLAAWLHHPGDRHPRTAVEAAALASLAAENCGRTELGARRLRDSLSLALSTGILAPLLDLGSDLRAPLEREVDSLGPLAPAALELLDRVQVPAGRGLIEPLTDREVQILRRLPTLMSNAEVGQALHLSVNTVKTHLKSLYRKLGAHSRRQAVQRGRELKVL